MPSYVIEFDSNHGPERRLFTLDDDRTLEVQLYQVLEELRQSDRVLRGAPGDELAVSWNGTELNLRTPLMGLGVDASRPLLLRMRPKPVVVAPVAARAARYTLRQMLLPPIEGALGALLAWAIAGTFSDLGPSLATYNLTDVAAAIAVGGLVGLALSGGSVARGLMGLPWAIVCTVMSAVAAVLLFGALSLVDGAPTVGTFLGARIAGWATLAGVLSLIATVPLRALGGQRFAEALIVALCAGLLSALIASLPGASLLWQAIAFVACGALVGGGAISIPIWRTNMLTPR